MNAKVAELFSLLTALPDTDQTEIAERLLEDLRWELTLHQPGSIEALDALREKAEIARQNGALQAVKSFSQVAKTRKKRRVQS